METAQAKRFNQQHYVVSIHSIQQFRARHTEKTYRSLKDSEIALMVDQMVYQAYLQRDLQFIYDNVKNVVSKVIKLPPSADGKSLYAILRPSDWHREKETIITLFESHMRESYLERGRWKVVSATDYSNKQAVVEQKPSPKLPPTIAPVQPPVPAASVSPPAKRREWGSVQQSVLELIKQAGEEGGRAADFAKALDLTRLHIGSVLTRLRNQGKIEMLGTAKSSSCRWRVMQYKPSSKKVAKVVAPSTKEVALRLADLLVERAKANREVAKLEALLAATREKLTKLDIDVANADLNLHRAAEKQE